MDAASSTNVDLQERIAALNRAVFTRESHAAARLYRDLVAEQPGLLLRPAVQIDLARLLELGGELELAMKAFEAIVAMPDGGGEHRATSLRQIGNICFRLRRYDECYSHMSAFLETDPAKKDRQEVEELISRLPPGTRRASLRTSQTDAAKLQGIMWEAPAVASAGENRFEQFRPVPEERMDSAPIIITGINLKGQPISPPQSRPRRLDLEPDGETEPIPPAHSAPPQEWATPRKSSAPAPRQQWSDSERQPEQSEISADDFAAAPPPVPPPQRAPAAKPATSASSGKSATPPAPAASARSAQREREPRFESKGPLGPAPAFSSWSSAAVPKFESPAPPPANKKPVRQQPTEHDSTSPPPGVRRTSAEIAKFTTADHSDSSIGGLGVEGAEDPASRYLRLRGATFAVLLPFGKRIHIEAVAELIARREDVDEGEAKKLSIARKGIVFDNLTMKELLELHPMARECRQPLVFVHVDRTLRPHERFDVLGAESLPPGLKMTTERGIKKARWGDVRLLSTGGVEGLATIEMFSGVPLKQYRFQEGSFNFRTVVQSARRDPKRGLIDFMQLLAEQAPKAVRAHTFDKFVANPAGKPQPFTSAEEFDSYNRWILFSHFAEVVDVDELDNQQHALSNW